MYPFKSKDSEIKPYSLSLDNILTEQKKQQKKQLKK